MNKNEHTSNTISTTSSILYGCKQPQESYLHLSYVCGELNFNPLKTSIAEVEQEKNADHETAGVEMLNTHIPSLVFIVA